MTRRPTMVIGKFAVLTALLWIINPNSSLATDNKPFQPSFSFTSLETADLAKSEAFYMGALGFKRIIQLTPPNAPVVKVGYNFSGDLNSPEPMLILIHYVSPTPTENHSSGAKIGFNVADARAVMDRIRAAGFNVTSDAKKSPDTPIIKGVAHDPDGVTVEIVELTSQH